MTNAAEVGHDSILLHRPKSTQDQSQRELRGDKVVSHSVQWLADNKIQHVSSNKV